MADAAGTFSPTGILDVRTEVARLMFPDNPDRYRTEAENLMRAGYINIEAVFIGIEREKGRVTAREQAEAAKSSGYRGQR